MKCLQKPNVDLYYDLLEVLLLPDYVSQSSYFQSHSRRDFRTISSRMSSTEGFQFCTKTLPKLGKALHRGLVEGQFQCPSEFKTKKGTRIPALMQGFFALIFDAESGMLLPRASPRAIQHVANICFCFYKLELGYTDKEESNVIGNFLETESELGQSELDASIESSIDVRIASEMTGGTIYDSTPVNIFGNFDPKDILPKHGPGAVATGEKGEEKWKFSRLYSPIHTEYPYWQYTMLPGMYNSNDPMESITHLTVSPEGGEAKVCLVPKDSRGPRLISSEPLEYMWFQQGLGGAIVSHLERDCSHTRGQVNFTSQSINRLLALTGSTQEEVLSPHGYSEIRAIRRCKIPVPSTRNGVFVTLDLKDASDRVGLALVKGIFSKVPLLLRCLLALRSTATCLPDGRRISLKKYAPMGSALCFPVEAYCFWILIVAAVSRNSALPLFRIMKQVFVYGDDIVVHKDFASDAVRVLESVGLKVNISKSCLKGRFRESCGMDAFDGVPVTPVKCRTLWTGKRSDYEALVSWVSYANQYRKLGYENAFHTIKYFVEKTYGAIPFGLPDCGYIAWETESWTTMMSVNTDVTRSRYSPRYQAVQFLVRRIVAKKLSTTLDGYPRLLRNLVCGPGDWESNHFYSLPRRSLIRRGWSVAS